MPTQPQMAGILSHAQSFCLLLFLCFTKIKPLKSYEKCFLFHLKLFYGSCNIQILGGN